jgi:hypothetical protein
VADPAAQPEPCRAAERFEQRLEPADEHGTVLRGEGAEGDRDLAAPLRLQPHGEPFARVRRGNEDPPPVGRILASVDEPGVRQPVDNLGGGRHRNIERGGNLPDRRRPPEPDLEEHLSLAHGESPRLGMFGRRGVEPLADPGDQQGDCLDQWSVIVERRRCFGRRIVHEPKNTAPNLSAQGRAA